MEAITSLSTQSGKGITLRELCVFAMLGALMFASKLIMEVLPNIHILGLLIVVYTIAFRAKALIPIYIWIMLNGLLAGFATWWIPYLYVWAVLWGMTMLLPKKMHPTQRARPIPRRFVPLTPSVGPSLLMFGMGDITKSTAAIMGSRAKKPAKYGQQILSKKAKNSRSVTEKTAVKILFF